jgi:hypothetical protein
MRERSLPHEAHVGVPMTLYVSQRAQTMPISMACSIDAEDY